LEILRFSRDVYGREVLEGMSWDLIGVFFGLGVAVIVVHAVYRRWLAPRGDAPRVAVPHGDVPRGDTG
jgi:hypothetical protein